ncbi:MAG: hypothetical protein IKI92_03555, partial [Anaerotignum sp.]|nr:hypothetical protein [Anaerotignum sp.]
VQSRTESLSDFAGLFDAIESKDVSGKDLIANLEGQVKIFQEWQKNMAELQGKGVAGGLLAELRELGPDSADEVAALNKLTEAELNKYIQLFEEKGRLAKQQAQDEIGPLLIAQAAQDAVGELHKNLQADAASMGNAITGAVTTAVAGAKQETAAGSMEQIILGMQEQYPALEEYVETTKEEIIALIESFWGNFRNVGEDMMDGVAQGIRDGRSGVVNAVAAVIAAAIARAKSDLDINSPSRVFAEMGEYSMEGYALGMQNRLKNTIQTMRNSMAMVTSVPVPAVGASGGQTYSNTYGDINLYIDTVNNGNGRDTQTLARELEFFRRQQNAGRGGT